MDGPLKSNVRAVSNVHSRIEHKHRNRDHEFRKRVRGFRALHALIVDSCGTVIHIESAHIETLPTEAQRREFCEARYCMQCGLVIYGQVRRDDGTVKWSDVPSCYCASEDPSQESAETLWPPILPRVADG